jgi:hypothetical protein
VPPWVDTWELPLPPLLLTDRPVTLLLSLSPSFPPCRRMRARACRTPRPPGRRSAPSASEHLQPPSAPPSATCSPPHPIMTTLSRVVRPKQSFPTVPIVCCEFVQSHVCCARVRGLPQQPAWPCLLHRYAANLGQRTPPVSRRAHIKHSILVLKHTFCVLCCCAGMLPIWSSWTRGARSAPTPRTGPAMKQASRRTCGSICTQATSAAGAG